MNKKKRGLGSRAGPGPKTGATAVAQVQRAVGCIQSGQFDQALQLCQAVLRADRRNFDALQLGAIAHTRLGHLQDALRFYQAAIKIDANYPDLYNNFGNALKDLGRFEDALVNYRRAIRLRPDFTMAHTNIGAVLIKLKRYEEALESLDRAQALAPGVAPGVDSGLAELHNNFGNAYFELKQLDAAIASFHRALQINPNFATAHFNLGNVLIEAGRANDAIANFERALALKPDYHDVHNNLGNGLRELKRPVDAVACYRRALELQPDHRFALSNLAQELRGICDWGDYDVHEKALAASLRIEKQQVVPLVYLNFYDTPDTILANVKKNCRYMTGAIERFAPAKPAASGKISLAYVSADYHDHPVAAVMAGIFERHDRSKFDVHAIALGGPSQTAMRGRLKRAFDSWHDVDGKSDREAAQVLRDIGADIAIDLTGYTRDGRQHIFAHRPAPIQVNYLGYPGSQGADFFDYIIADPFIVRPDQDKFFAEKIVRLPDSYMVGDPDWRIAEETPTRAAYGLPDEGFVFASFNNCLKITPAVFDVWMQLLADHPGSVLWFSKPNQWAEENLRKEASRRGVEPERLIATERCDDFSDHLARHRLADLFLDTAPYNAHATTMSALWAGLPVLTCAGESFAARVAGSLLTTAGLTELITPDLAAYAELAAALVADPARLAGYRAHLDEIRDTSPLFDCDRFTRNLEAAYERMIARARDGAPPKAFALPYFKTLQE